ncbi:MAG: sugar nucleotide-binding protein, partial [Acidobacteriota bacterium]
VVDLDAPAHLAEACARHNARLVTFSTDQVFDGERRRPYVETDRAEPVNVYGISKLEGEARVRAALPEALIIRSAACFGPDDFNALTAALRTLGAGESVSVPHDSVVSPTYLPDLVGAALDLSIDREEGLWHVSHGTALTWYDFVRVAAGWTGLDPARVVPAGPSGLDGLAPRPAYSALGSVRGALLPTLDDAVVRYVDATRMCLEAVVKLRGHH